MKPFKPLYLKTYGKQMRKVSAWISPDDRKRRAFDSTPSSDETSGFQPANRPRALREKRTRVNSPREVRSAKRRAMLCLTEKSLDEDDMSDEENVCPPRLVPACKSRNSRISNLASAPAFARQRGQKVSFTSESEEETSAVKRKRTSVKMKKKSVARPPSAGRFVTRRRCAASTKAPIEKTHTLDSSDDFTSAAFGFSRIRRPSRRRKAPPAFGLSSAESSANAAGTSSFTNIPFREISLNESGDHSLGPSSRKPIFCSTPSAASFGKHLKPSAFQNQIASPPSVSCIELDSPQQPFSPTQSAPLSGETCQRGPGLHHDKNQSLDSYPQPERGSCSEGAKSLSADSEAKHDGELHSVDLFSADSENSSQFVSAAGGLEWLIEALKQKCLSQSCTVQLERLACLPVTQLCSPTTYSSCLECSSSLDSQQTKELLQSVDTSRSPDLPRSSADSLYRRVSETENENRDHFQLVKTLDLSVSASDGVSGSLSEEGKRAAELSNIKSGTELSESKNSVDSTHRSDHSSEIVKGTELPTAATVQTRCTDVKVEAAVARGVSKKCSVLLQKIPSLQLQLKGFAQAGAACRERFVDQDANLAEKEESTASVRKSKSRPVAETMCTDSEQVAGAASQKQKKCLSKKASLPRPKGAPLRSSADVSKSAGNDQTKVGHLSESDADENSTKISTMSGRSTSPDIASGKETESPSKVLPKRKKESLAPKENMGRSVLSNQTGTARKVCVTGMSVSRWKNKGGGGALAFRTAKTSGAKAVDCSISELISKQHNQPTDLGATVNFSTPLRAGQPSLMSLLADLTPSTHTWSRLKAVLSVHRKVQLTPRSSHRSALGSPVRTMLSDISRDLFVTPSRAALSSRLSSQLLSQCSPALREEADLSDAEKVFAECGQRHPLPWEECILPHRMKQCVKIGEGTFGEVFSTSSASGDTVALKIIPVEGREKVNGEDQKSFGEILHEIIISKELSSLKEKKQNQSHGFIGLNDLHCVQGCYPADFLKAWDAFDQRKGSENDRPDFFENDQLFLILEFEFGGIDLENSNGTLASLGVAKSILHQVTAALAVAEQELHFEHRDLHWGNVLVKTTEEKTMNFLLNGTDHCVEIKGVLVRIIDYSLSRLEIDDLTVSCDISNDEELFMGQGDYQFEVYRLMRQENGNNWSDYHPHTNVLWLHYLCSKLLSIKYRSNRGKAAKDARKELTCFYNNVLQYRSATEALQSCTMFQEH